MSERSRSLGPLGGPTSWSDVPRWQRLGFFWAALLLAVAYCIKSGSSESWLLLIFALLAGRLSATLFDLKAVGRGSASPPTSIVEDR